MGYLAAWTLALAASRSKISGAPGRMKTDLAIMHNRGPPCRTKAWRCWAMGESETGSPQELLKGSTLAFCVHDSLVRGMLLPTAHESKGSFGFIDVNGSYRWRSESCCFRTHALQVNAPSRSRRSAKNSWAAAVLCRSCSVLLLLRHGILPVNPSVSLHHVVEVQAQLDSAAALKPELGLGDLA